MLVSIWLFDERNEEESPDKRENETGEDKSTEKIRENRILSFEYFS